MTSLQVTVEPLSKKVMEKPTASIAGSIAYSKFMVRLSAMNIVYNRINFDENTFNKHKIGDSYYMHLNHKVNKSHQLFQIYHGLRCAADEIQKRFLKQLYLVFHDKNTKVVLEKYKFDITYDPTDDGTTLPIGSSIVKITSDFFNKIHNLKQINLWNADDIEFSLQIITNENSPIDYVPLFFEHGDYCNLGEELSEYYFIGAVSTGFHEIKLDCSLNNANTEYYRQKSICGETMKKEVTGKADKSLEIVEIESGEDANNRTIDGTLSSDAHLQLNI